MAPDGRCESSKEQVTCGQLYLNPNPALNGRRQEFKGKGTSIELTRETTGKKTGFHLSDKNCKYIFAAADEVFTATVLTVALSALLQGISAAPLANAYTRLAAGMGDCEENKTAAEVALREGHIEKPEPGVGV